MPAVAKTHYVQKEMNLRPDLALLKSAGVVLTLFQWEQDLREENEGDLL